MMNNKLFRKVFSILLAIAMLFGISVVAIAASGNGGGGGNAGIQSNMAGTGFQIRLSDPDTSMTNDGGTYVLDNKYDSTKDIVFTFSLNPNGGQKGFGIYPASNGEPAGFDGVVIYDNSDPNKTPVLSLGGNYNEDTINTDFFFEETVDSGYPDHYVFNMATESTFSNERSSKLTIKANTLKPGKTYSLYFPSTIKTYNNGSAKQLGSDVTIEFETDVDSEAPTFLAATANKAVPPGGIECNPNFSDGIVNYPWEQDEIGMELRVDPKGIFANEYAEENYKQFSVTSYYGEEVPITVGPGRTNKNYTFYKINMTLPEPGWYCLTVGKNFKNDAGKTLGDYTGGEDWTYWILKPNTREQNGSPAINPTVNLTTNLQNISYEDVSSYNSNTLYGDISMYSLASNYPDPGYIVKLTATEGYTLPSKLSVTVDGKELAAGKDYEYTPNSLQSATVVKDSRNGTVEEGEAEYNLIINRHALNGPVVVTASAVKPVTGVALDKTELTLDEKTTEVLTATVSPEDATNKNVSWSSSDEAIATVDKDGKVTALKAGTATITATTEDGEKTATCAVTVNHVEEALPAKEPTCTEPGLTEGKKCSACGEVLKEQEEIPAFGHDYKDGVCTRCGQKDPNYVEPTKPEEPTTQKEEPTTQKEEPTTQKEEPTTQKQEEPTTKPATPTKKLNGLVKGTDGKWALYKEDSVQKSFTGLAKNENGWYYLKNGYVDWNYTGFAKNEKGWWRVKDGRVDFNANSIYKQPSNGVWYKTTNGFITWDETGVFKNVNGWWRVENSRVNFYADGIYKNENGWWKTTGGKVHFNETGIFSNENGKWYVKNSKVDFSKNGKVTFKGKTYTVTNGYAKLS